MKIPQDELFAKMASLYVQQEGQLLLDELKDVEGEEPRITPRMDAKVKAGTSSNRKRNYRIGATLAACLALALLIPNLIRYTNQNMSQTAMPEEATMDNLMSFEDGGEVLEEPEMEMADEAAPEAPDVQPFLTEEHVEEPIAPQTGGGELAPVPATGGTDEPTEEAPAPTEEAPAVDEPMMGGSDEEAPVAAEENPVTGGDRMGGEGVGIIPLSFALPPNLMVASVEEDNGKSIYYLQNTQADDVVLTLEYADEYDFAGLDTAQINGSTVYYKYRSDYSLVTFEKEGVLYEMTCKHDVATLMDLSSYIL